MADPAITILVVSEESVTSVVLRVILFGTIPTEIPIIPNMPTDLPTISKLPAVSPFLCSDDSESESADESLERHISSSPDTTISSTEIATASHACISTPIIIASPAVHIYILTTIRKSTLGLRPMMMPTRSAALHRVRRAALSLETSSSDTLSGSLSDLSRASSSSIGPSQKRSRSSATSISSIVCTAGVLSSNRVDLLPPRKMYRVTSVMHSDESANEAIAIIVEIESEPEEAEADEEANAESQP
ncbi:hypothetical protein Tco_1464017 [Tanacetum coccineum]